MKIPESNGQFSRRRFLNRSALAGLALTSTVASASGDAIGEAPDATTQPTKVYPNAETADAAPDRGPQVRPGSMPCGWLGSLKISRLISGGNIISGWCHSRDLQFVRPLAQAYLTEKKQFDTLQLLEERGVNAIAIDMMQMSIVEQYRRERGGKMHTIVGIRQDWGAWNNPSWADLKTQIQRALEEAPGTLFVHGGYADRLVQSGKPERVDLIGQALQYIRDQKIPAGLGAHALEVPVACEQRGIEPDYFFKTFHHDQYWSATPKERRKRFCVDGPRLLDHNEFHDNIFCIDPEETIAFMRNKKQPWIAFKVLAAGAIPPASGFQYAFENGADFLAVGMFDFEVAEDISLVRDLLQTPKRERPWRA